MYLLRFKRMPLSLLMITIITVIIVWLYYIKRQLQDVSILEPQVPGEMFKALTKNDIKRTGAKQPAKLTFDVDQIDIDDFDDRDEVGKENFGKDDLSEDGEEDQSLELAHDEEDRSLELAHDEDDRSLELAHDEEDRSLELAYDTDEELDDDAADENLHKKNQGKKQEKSEYDDYLNIIGDKKGNNNERLIHSKKHEGTVTVISKATTAPVSPNEKHDIIHTEKTTSVSSGGFKFKLKPPVSYSALLNPGVDHAEAEDLFYRFAVTLEIDCQVMQRFGHSDDGGWSLCVAGPYQPQTNKCLVYSFGINYDFSFDDDVASIFGCEVHSYDPSMVKADSHHRSMRVWFHKIGISNEDVLVDKHGWKLLTFKRILERNRHINRTIDILKLDIEHDEWTVLWSIFKDGLLHNVKQLVFEIHTSEVYPLNQYSSREDYIYMYKTLTRLEDFGFKRCFVHGNSDAKFFSANTKKLRFCCYEYAYINTRFLPN